MNVSLYEAAAAMNASARWQDMITDNLAASATPGARERGVSFASLPVGTHFAIPALTTGVNFQPGELRPTSNPMNFAIEGSGFFEVQLPNGEHAFTRDGEFHLNPQGQLVTKSGYAVIGESGPVQLDPSNSSQPLSVSPTGEVSQGGEVRGKLKVTEFNNPQLLTAMGSSVFRADNPKLEQLKNPASQIAQGYTEASNISPTVEMSSLIMSMRAFEANQKVIQMQDDRMGREISDLGNPT